ncbi:NADH-quinone oxidoreductase subunit L [Salinispirillum marinum]|uniref:Probable inorganic carbon transporter subunit DabB n=2 Tax=Saccharospirillaceae TaxID=255527 RepID=A0ABV8BBB2_9GAMM
MEPSLWAFGPLNLIMLGLVTVIGGVVLHFSRAYLAGDAQVGRYYRWMVLTLVAVAVTVTANHLFLLLAGWVAISLALHRLLTHYPERRRAQLASHKKFLLARVAELTLLTSFLLILSQQQTPYISEIVAHYRALLSGEINGTLSVAEQVAAVGIAVAALIKCAQLPVHGWLMQVVEAPTPVSALLHAGIINLGGFLLLVFAPLIAMVPAAQWLILIVAGLTTLVSALVMTTRISQKVRLAWSTSAQMGLMLVECALGLYELALLHLLSHSAYKAYAFLNSGHAVWEDVQHRLAPRTTPRKRDWATALPIALLIVLGVVFATQYHGPVSPWLLLTLALALLLAENGRQRGFSGIRSTVLVVLGLAVSYGTLKSLLGQWVALPHTVSLYADLWVSALIIVLFLLSGLLRYRAHTPAMQKLSVWLFAGFYLDEWFSRLTLLIWPLETVPHDTPSISRPAHPVKEVV